MLAETISYSVNGCLLRDEGGDGVDYWVANDGYGREGLAIARDHRKHDISPGTETGEAAAGPDKASGNRIAGIVQPPPAMRQ